MCHAPHNLLLWQVLNLIVHRNDNAAIMLGNGLMVQSLAWQVCSCCLISGISHRCLCLILYDLPSCTKPPLTVLPGVAMLSAYLACQVVGFCASLQCTCMCLFSSAAIVAAELSMKHHTVCRCGSISMLRIPYANTVMGSDNSGKRYIGQDNSGSSGHD